MVTPKEVDLLIDDAAGIIADGINLAIHNGLSMEDVNGTFIRLYNHLSHDFHFPE